MYRIGAACGFLAALVIVAVAPAGQPGHGLATASGMVEKVDKESLAIQTRGPGGKFAKPVVLKITGTSKITVVSEEKRGTAYGFYNLAYGITVLPASLLFGLLWSSVGVKTAFGVSAAISIIAAILFLKIKTNPPIAEA